MVNPDLYDLDSRDIGQPAVMGLWLLCGKSVTDARAAAADKIKKKDIDSLFHKLISLLPDVLLEYDEHGIVQALTDLNIMPLCAQTIEHMLCEYRKMCSPERRVASANRYAGYKELWSRVSPIYARRVAKTECRNSASSSQLVRRSSSAASSASPAQCPLVQRLSDDVRGAVFSHVAAGGVLCAVAGKHFKDICLIVAFNRLGFLVPCERSGPYWLFGDGRRMLAPFGYTIMPCVGYPTSPGLYLHYFNRHFQGMCVASDHVYVYNNFEPCVDMRIHDLK